MYFSGEETTVAVRGFTHGYDPFHPTSVVPGTNTRATTEYALG
jgi:hypothetical protein